MKLFLVKYLLRRSLEIQYTEVTKNPNLQRTLDLKTKCIILKELQLINYEVYQKLKS